jgi:hypothetical protein
MKMVWGLLALLALAHGPAAALNKCTDAAGQTTYQDAPCASSQKKVEMEWDPKPSTNVVTPADRSVRSLPRIEPNEALEGPAEAGALIALYRRWIDAERLAGSTARIALAGPVSQLQALRRETEALSVPSCVSDARSRLRELVSRTVDVHLAFMQKLETTAMLYNLLDRDQLVRGFEDSVRAVRCQR